MSKVKFKKPNFDTLTPSSTKKVTSKLLGYLDEVNPDAKQYVEYLLSSDRHADINSKVDTSKLEKLDAKILEVLKKIEENMIDEQDTSIKYKDRASEAGVGFWLGDDFWETETAGADSESDTDLFVFRRPKTLTERRKRIEERRRKREERRRKREERRRKREERRRKREERRRKRIEERRKRIEERRRKREERRKRIEERRRKRIEERRKRIEERRKRNSDRLNRSSNKEPKPKARASEIKVKKTETGIRVASEANANRKIDNSGANANRKVFKKNIFEEITKASKTNFVKKALEIGVKPAFAVAKFAVKLATWPVAAVLAAADAAAGYQNASENLGVKESELTTTNKISSAVASALSLGLMDADYMSKAVNNSIGGNPDLKRFEAAGLIKHVDLGDSKITDWDAIEKLSKDDIARIINIDDWSKEDEERLNELYQKASDKPKRNDDSKFKLADQVQNIDKNMTVIQLDNLGIINQSLIGNSKIADWDVITALPEANVDRLIEFNDWDESTLVRLKGIKSIAKDVDAFKKTLPKMTKAEQTNAVKKKLNVFIKKRSELKDSRDATKRQLLDDGIRAYTHVLDAIKHNRIEAKDQRYEPLSVADINAASVNLQNVDLKPGVYSTLTEEFPTGDLTLGIAPGEKLPPMDLKPSNATFNLHDEVGVLSEKYETGGRGVGTISSGRGDPGGISYGSWQLSSNAGTLDAYLKSPEAGKYGKQFAGLKINSPEFQKRWKQVAATDPAGFAKSQHDFLLRQNVNPVMSYAASKGIDIGSKTIQNVLWSQAIQHGLKGNREIIDLAVKKASPADTANLVEALYDARATYVAKLPGLQANTKESLIRRYKAEGSDALAMWAQESKGSKKSNQASVKEAAARVPVSPKPAVVNKAAEANSVNSYNNNIINSSTTSTESILKAATAAGAAAGLQALQSFKQSEEVDSEQAAPIFTRFPITQDGRK